MWQLHLYVNKAASAVLNARLSVDGTGKKYSRSATGKTRYFTTYLQVANLSLKTYATDELIAKIDSDNTRFQQPSHIVPSQFAEKLVTKTILCGDV